jgi:hypothetical protein
VLERKVSSTPEKDRFTERKYWIIATYNAVMEDIEDSYAWLENMRALGASGPHEAIIRVQITEVYKLSFNL